MQNLTAFLFNLYGNSVTDWSRATQFKPVGSTYENIRPAIKLDTVVSRPMHIPPIVIATPIGYLSALSMLRVHRNIGHNMDPKRKVHNQTDVKRVVTKKIE